MWYYQRVSAWHKCHAHFGGGPACTDQPRSAQQPNRADDVPARFGRKACAKSQNLFVVCKVTDVGIQRHRLTSPHWWKGQRQKRQPQLAHVQGVVATEHHLQAAALAAPCREAAVALPGVEAVADVEQINAGEIHRDVPQRPDKLADAVVHDGGADDVRESPPVAVSHTTFVQLRRASLQGGEMTVWPAASLCTTASNACEGGREGEEAEAQDEAE